MCCTSLCVGVMRIADFPLIFNDDEFPMRWKREYIRLLTTFEGLWESGGGSGGGWSGVRGQGVRGRVVRGRVVRGSGGGGSVGQVVTQLDSSAALTGDQGEGLVATQ